MVRSMTSGVAGLRSHQTRMDVIGNNIANVNTYGFKSSRAAFKDALYMTLNGSNNATATYGGGNAMQIGYGSTVGSVDVLHIRGSYAPTDYATDVMIDGIGYFLVGTNEPAGYPVDSVTELSLTRLGSFNFDGLGNLVDTGRSLVYGFAPEYTYTPRVDGNDNPVLDANGVQIVDISWTYDMTKVVPISMPAVSATDPTKMNLKQITFGADGAIVGINDQGLPVEVGKIAVANVPNPSALEMVSNSYFKAKANTGDVVASVPGENTTGALKSGGLEMSNVDLAREFTDMITTQRGFQANSRIITVTDEMLNELVNIKR